MEKFNIPLVAKGLIAYAVERRIGTERVQLGGSPPASGAAMYNWSFGSVNIKWTRSPLCWRSRAPLWRNGCRRSALV